MFDCTPAHLLQCHHRVTRQFLDKTVATTWRTHVDTLVTGVPLETLSEGFQTAVGSFLFVPIVERVIEAHHKDVKHVLGDKTRHTEAAVSLALRLRMLETRFQRPGGDKAFEEFSAAVDCLRTPKTCAAEFGMAAHPMLRNIASMCSATLGKLIRQITYRSDLHTQFQDHSAAAAANATAQRSKPWKKRPTKSAPLHSLDAVLIHALPEHVRSISADSSVFFRCVWTTAKPESVDGLISMLLWLGP